MSITKYTNFTEINSKTQNEGQFIESKDLFIVNQQQIEDTEFGECEDDTMEVSVYDINNNLLPQKNGSNVAYIKTGDIKNYLHNINNNTGKKEVAIDIEKLLNDIGFTNGILKVNINFVRNKVGTDDSRRRLWIQEISPSREEIRVVVLKTNDDNLNSTIKKEFEDLKLLRKDFKYYKKSILDSVNSYETMFLTSIDDYLVSQYGKDFFNVLKTDFGLSNFNDFKQRIFKNFKDSVTYFLTNKNYDVTDSTFGQPSIPQRFDDCESYDFGYLTNEINGILTNCIKANSYFLKRRDINIQPLDKTFEVVQTKKDVQDSLNAFPTNVNLVHNVYDPTNVEFTIKPNLAETPILPTAPVVEPPLDIKPAVIVEPTPIVIQPEQPVVIQPAPVKGGGGGGAIFNGMESMYYNSGLAGKAADVTAER